MKTLDSSDGVGDSIQIRSRIPMNLRLDWVLLRAAEKVGGRESMASFGSRKSELASTSQR